MMNELEPSKPESGSTESLVRSNIGFWIFIILLAVGGTYLVTRPSNVTYRSASSSSDGSISEPSRDDAPRKGERGVVSGVPYEVWRCDSCDNLIKTQIDIAIDVSEPYTAVDLKNIAVDFFRRAKLVSFESKPYMTHFFLFIYDKKWRAIDPDANIHWVARLDSTGGAHRITDPTDRVEVRLDRGFRR